MFKKGQNGWNKGLTKETDERVKKISEAMKGEKNHMYGKHLSKEHKLKISQNAKINPNYGMKGKHMSLESRKKLSESKKGKYCGENNHFFGKHHTKESKRKLSEAHKGKPSPMKGKLLLEETKRKISNSVKEFFKTHPEIIKKMSGKNNPNYGKHPSKETRRKMSESQKGRTHTKETKIKMSKWHKGKYVSPETREKISKSHKGLLVGEKNGMYRKNHTDISRKKMSASKQDIPLSQWEKFIDFEPYTLDFNRKFKKSIKERDFHCCQLCNMGEEDLLLLKRCLVIHHIDYNKRLSIPENCITLCSKCNTIVNFNRKHWTVFFQKLLKERYNYQYTQDQKVILDFIERGDETCKTQ